MAAVEKPKPPSKTEREWKGLAGDLEKLAERIDTLMMRNATTIAAARRVDDLLQAAHDLAKPEHGITPPRVEPERIEEDPEGISDPAHVLWNMERGLTEARRSLGWLIAVTRHAEARAAARKAEAGGGRPDLANDWLIQNLASLYAEATEQAIDQPAYNEKQENWTGRFLDFADPVLATFAGHDRDNTAMLIRRRLFGAA